MNEWVLNPFTLKSSSRSIVCYFHTFGNNLGIKRKFAKYFKESCCLSSDQHFTFKCFQKNVALAWLFQKKLNSRNVLQMVKYHVNEIHFCLEELSKEFF